MQTFGASMQINEALFSGSDGYVLKPPALRAGGDGKLSTGRSKKLHLQIAGATDVPVPTGREPGDIKPYISCTLVHPDNLTDDPPKRKTKAYKHHKVREALKGEGSPVTDPVWDETLEWEYEENELVFLRILLKSDDAFARNPIFAVAAVRLSYVARGWKFIRLLDLKGRETKCSLLAKFHIDDI
jgi:phosphatidylinositol phospholipase C, delta